MRAKFETNKKIFKPLEKRKLRGKMLPRKTPEEEHIIEQFILANTEHSQSAIHKKIINYGIHISLRTLRRRIQKVRETYKLENCWNDPLNYLDLNFGDQNSSNSQDDEYLDLDYFHEHSASSSSSYV